jgi:hypothetical protein
LGPRACYDEGKRCAKTLFFYYWRQHKLRIKVARIFNTYGPRMHPNEASAARQRQIEGHLPAVADRRPHAALPRHCAGARKLRWEPKVPLDLGLAKTIDFVFVRTFTNPSVSFIAMEDLQRTVASTIRADPAVDNLVSYISGGMAGVSSWGYMMVNLKPLAVGTGPGHELRQRLGIAIVGGLIVSQILTLYTTPVIYLYLDRFRLWSQRKWHRHVEPLSDAHRLKGA